MKDKASNPFKQATKVLEILQKHQHEAYFVGGCVRDLLLGQDIKDIDITTSATPKELGEIFETVIPVGLEHGTVIVRFEHTSYEITTFRGDTSNKHFELNITHDLERRDFTMNAMTMNIQGDITDLFSGKRDLNNKVIRTVHHPINRFTEDPLRILRAIRFASQLGFTIEPTTYHEMGNLKHLLETVATERITSELELIFQGKYVQHALTYIQELNIDKYIPVWKENSSLSSVLPKRLTAFHSLAEVIVLFHYLDEQMPISAWINGWKCSNKTKRSAKVLYQALISYMDEGIDNWLVYILPKEERISFCHLIYVLTNEIIDKKIVEQAQYVPIMNRSELAINGNDLKKFFSNRPNGSWIRKGMESIEYEIVMGRLSNTKNAIKEWIRCHPPEIN